MISTTEVKQRLIFFRHFYTYMIQPNTLTAQNQQHPGAGKICMWLLDLFLIPANSYIFFSCQSASISQIMTFLTSLSDIGCYVDIWVWTVGLLVVLFPPKRSVWNSLGVAALCLLSRAAGRSVLVSLSLVLKLPLAFVMSCHEERITVFHAFTL